MSARQKTKMSSILWAGVAEKLLSVIERFLDPAQYSIVKSKRMQKALNTAEDEFELCSEILCWIEDNMVINTKEIKGFNKRHTKLKTRFNKYD